MKVSDGEYLFLEPPCEEEDPEAFEKREREIGEIRYENNKEDQN